MSIDNIGTILRQFLPDETNPVEVTLPLRTKILGAASMIEDGEVTHSVWIMSPLGDAGPSRTWKFWVLMTGDTTPEFGVHLCTHVGVDLSGRPYVVHFYFQRVDN